MAVNPDPKPGRWILPLVVLGMIAFTYFFVRELPEASTQTTLVASPGTTGPEGTGDPGDTPGTTVSGTTPDPATQAYLTEIDAINQELQAQRTDLSAVNTAFNADPREIEFPDAEDRFEAIQAATQALAERHAALTPPAALQANQVDAVMAGMSITDERKKVFDFSDPYFTSGVQLGVLENSDVQSLDDLDGKTVAVKTGTQGQTFAEENQDAYVKPEKPEEGEEGEEGAEGEGGEKAEAKGEESDEGGDEKEGE